MREIAKQLNGSHIIIEIIQDVMDLLRTRTKQNFLNAVKDQKTYEDEITKLPERLNLLKSFFV